MSTDALFMKATRAKIRFETSKGLLSIEDLWDLPLTSATGKTNLDDIAKEVNRQLKGTQEESFVIKETKGNELLQLKLEIAKIVIAEKMAERDAAVSARADAEWDQKILALMEKKKDENIAGSSMEELQKMLRNRPGKGAATAAT